jgi:hypothetical protein
LSTVSKWTDTFKASETLASSAHSQAGVQYFDSFQSAKSLGTLARSSVNEGSVGAREPLTIKPSAVPAGRRNFMKAWLFVALLCVVPSMDFAHAGMGGGGSIEEMNRFRQIAEFQSTLDSNRKSLQQILQSLTDDEAAQVIPPSLGKKLMIELVGNVEYRQYSRSNSRNQDPARDEGRVILRDSSGVVRSAIAEQHKVSLLELKAFVEKGNSLDQQKMKEKLSPIVFDTELITQQLAKSGEPMSKLLSFVYYMHLTQMGLKLDELYIYTGAFIDLLNRRAENKN